jgi:hypothetical protein
VLNGIKMTEKYPDLLTIKDLEVDTRTKVETYQAAISEIQKQQQNQQDENEDGNELERA